MLQKFIFLKLLLAFLFFLLIFSDLNIANGAVTAPPPSQCSKSQNQIYCDGTLGCEQTCITCFDNGFTYGCWGAPACIEGGFGCTGGGGTDPLPPANGCTPGSSWCVSSTTYNTCIQVADGSWQGGAVQSCSPGQTCSGGSCVNTAPPPAPTCSSVCASYGLSCSGACGSGYCCGSDVCNGSGGCCPGSAPYYYDGGCHSQPYSPPPPPPSGGSCTQPYCTFGNRLTNCDGSYSICDYGCTGSAGSATCAAAPTSGGGAAPPPPPSGGTCDGPTGVDFCCGSQLCRKINPGDTPICSTVAGKCGVSGGGAAPPPPPPAPSCTGSGHIICGGSCWSSTCTGSLSCSSSGTPVCTVPPPTCGAGEVACGGSCWGVAGSCSGGWTCSADGSPICSGGFTPPDPTQYSGTVRIDSNNNGRLDLATDAPYVTGGSGGYVIGGGVQGYPGGQLVSNPDGSQYVLPCSPDPAYLPNCYDPSSIGVTTGVPTDSSGNWSADSYRDTLTMYFKAPAGYTSVTPNSVVVSSLAVFYPTHTKKANFLIKANNFNVVSNVRTVSDPASCTATSGSAYAGANLNIQGGTTNLTQATNASGVTVFNVLPQSYTLSLQVPSGYNVVGRQIPTGGSASGTNGMTFILAANTTASFCIAPTDPWFQTDLGDVRFRALSVPVPAGKYASTGNQAAQYPGIYYSSNSNANTGSGSVSAIGWLVNNEYSYNANTENRNGTISYSFYKSRAKNEGVTITPLTPGTLNSSEITGSGVYEANGDLTINSYTHTSGRRVVILSSGNITINTPITILPGEGLFIVAAKGNLTINSSVGTTTLSSTATQLEGYYSAEGSIILPTAASCPSTPDKRLNVGGVLIANSLKPFATSGTGSIQNNRSLCNENLNYPTLYVSSRPDFLTQLTDFYKVPYTKWKEERP